MRIIDSATAFFFLIKMPSLFYLPVNFIYVLLRRWKGDNERLRTMKCHSQELNSASRRRTITARYRFIKNASWATNGHMTFIPCRMQRHDGVNAALYKRHVPAGLYLNC